MLFVAARGVAGKVLARSLSLLRNGNEDHEDTAAVFDLERRRRRRRRRGRGRGTAGRMNSALGNPTLSEVGTTLAVGAALWRYNKLAQDNSLLLEAKVDEGEILSKDEDFDELEENESLERISSAFLAGLSCFPYLNWLPWVFLMSSAKANANETSTKTNENYYYYLCCAVLYAAPYLDLFGERDLATSIDAYVLVLGVLHLQLERSITGLNKETQKSVQQQWIDYDGGDSDRRKREKMARAMLLFDETNQNSLNTPAALDLDDQRQSEEGHNDSKTDDDDDLKDVG